MKTLSFFLISLFVTLNCFAQVPSDALLIAAESFKDVLSVPADVVIASGQVTKSNCDDLSKNNPDGITYSLRQDQKNYVCVPSKGKVSKLDYVVVGLGYEATIDNLRNEIHVVGEAYEKQNNITNGFFTAQATSPNCQLNADGTANLNSCTCGNNYSFDTNSKQCVRNPNILNFYANSCSESLGFMGQIVKSNGLDLIPPPDITFGSCSVQGHEFKVLPHPLVYKLFAFAYLRENFKKAVTSSMPAENIKLVISKNEIADYKAWLKTYSSPEFSADLISDAEQNIDMLLKYNLEKLVVLEQ